MRPPHLGMCPQELLRLSSKPRAGRVLAHGADMRAHGASVQALLGAGVISADARICGVEPFQGFASRRCAQLPGSPESHLSSMEFLLLAVLFISLAASAAAASPEVTVVRDCTQAARDQLGGPAHRSPVQEDRQHLLGPSTLLCCTGLLRLNNLLLSHVCLATSAWPRLPEFTSKAPSTHLDWQGRHCPTS